MKTTQQQVQFTLVGVRKFLGENAATVNGVISPATMADLDAAITGLSAHAADQVGHSTTARGKTKEHVSRRLELTRDHMAPISRIARIKLAGTEAVQALRMPKGNRSAVALANYARGMAQAAAPYKEVFITAGLPVDFLDRLTAAADAMMAPATDRLLNRAAVKGATGGIRTQAVIARQVLDVIDAFIRTAFKDDTAFLEKWNGVKSIRRTPARTTAVAAPVAPATETPSVSSAA